MAYFRCTTGGSGKGNTLVVTCADDLAGATITCTNGTKTYTKTCPSTAPYEVTFYGLEAGTYTVSATVSGNTYTTTVVVVDCTALLGGFNWRVWVDTARFLDSTDYNSLDEVLADEEAVRELCLEHACVDYLADITTASEDVETIINNDLFAKWVNNSDYALDFLGANVVIKALMDTADKYFYGEWVITDATTTPKTWGAKGNVPVMTSNSAPYGEVSASSEYSSGWAAWRAFDGGGSSTNAWMSNGSTNQYIRYKSVNPICVRAIEIMDFDLSTGGHVKNFRVEGSNDGTNFTPIYTGLAENGGDNIKRFTFDNDTYYLYHQIYIIDEYSTSHNIRGKFQFYGRELSVSVPTMTGNAAPYGEASANKTIYGSGYAYKAFNNDSTGSGSCTLVYNASMSDGRVHYKFTSAKKIIMAVYKTFSTSDNSRVKSARIVYSDDGTTWENASEVITFSASQTIIPINISEPHLYWGIGNIINGGNTGNVFVSELQFYGLDYSEKEFETGTTKKWLYDHGVELEEYSQYTSNGSITKEDSYVKFQSTANSAFCYLLAKNVSNLGDYNLIRCKMGAVYKQSSSDSHFLDMSVYSITNPTTQEGSRVSNAYMMPNDAPNNFSLAISSVSNGNYAAIVLDETNRTKEMDITEWWIE